MTADGPTGSLVFATERDGDGFATCCGMVRELDGSCAHRSHHPVYVDDGPVGAALRDVRDLHKPERMTDGSVWFAEASEYDYDEYDSFVIRADTAADAHRIAVLQSAPTSYPRVPAVWTDYQQKSMRKNPQVWSVRPLSEVEGPVLCASFNAG